MINNKDVGAIANLRKPINRGARVGCGGGRGCWILGMGRRSSFRRLGF